MEAGNPGEVSYPTYPLVKKYLSSRAIPGTWGRAKNAITRSLSTHINKVRVLTFVFFVCSDEAAFPSMSWLQAKLQFDSAD